MEKQRKSYPAEFKVEVLRDLLENGLPIGKVAEKYKLHPNLLYLWKKELFENAELIFSKHKTSSGQHSQIQELEAKLKDKDSLISELVEDNLKMKKKVNGGR